MIRDYPVEFFQSAVIERYGRPINHHVLKEVKKHFHSDPNLKNDIVIRMNLPSTSVWF